MGVTTAHALGTRGYRVTLIEQQAEVATGASRNNGGQLSWSHLDPLASVSTLRMLPAIVFGLDSAIELRAVPGPNLVRWGLRFIGNCRTDRERAGMKRLFRLAQLSQKALQGLNRQYELNYHRQAHGKLVLFSTQRELETARRSQPVRHSIGCGGEILPAAECVALEPAIVSMRHRITGGLHLAADEAGDSHLFCTQLAAHAERRGQVDLALNCRAKRIIVRNDTAVGVETDQGEIAADQVVLAAGMASAPLARTIGLRLPLLPVKGYSLNLPARPQAGPKLSVTDLRHKTVYSRIAGRFRMAGVHQIGAGSARRHEAKVRQLVRRARECFPEAANYDARPDGGAGLRPTTPDSRPIIGKTPLRNLWLNTGHGMLGWTLCCGSAELLAGMMAGKEATLDAADYGLERFKL